MALRVLTTSSGASAGPTLSISAVRFTPSDGVVVASVDEAEDKVFALAPELEIPLIDRDVIGYKGNAQIILCRLNQAAAMVAKASRRGMGNLAFLHPHIFAFLEDEPGFIQKDLGKNGRWHQYSGLGPGTSKFIFNVSDCLPAHSAYVAYVNSSTALTDGPAALAQDGQEFVLFEMKRGAATFNGSEDYLRRVDASSFLSLRELQKFGLLCFAELVDNTRKSAIGSSISQ